MIVVLGMILAALCCGPGWLAGAVALLAALYYAALGIFEELGIVQYLIIVFFSVAAPAAAYLAGAFLDTFSHPLGKGGVFRLVAVVMAFVLMLASEQLLENFGAALIISQGVVAQGVGMLQATALTAGILNGVVMCAGVTAFAVMLMHLIFEVPVLWVSGAFRSRGSYAFAALRPLSVIIIATLFFRYILEKFATELSPQTLNVVMGG